VDLEEAAWLMLVGTFAPARRKSRGTAARRRENKRRDDTVRCIIPDVAFSVGCGFRATPLRGVRNDQNFHASSTTLPCASASGASLGS
jgi:hypothetical protein